MIFTQTSKVEDAFNLPVGSYCANFGFLVQQSVKPEYVLEATTALLESGKDFTVASQAGIIVKAQELEVAFTDWPKLKIG